MISIDELYSLFRKCTGVTTDSRAVKSGMMFFALRGEKFDGNDFALDALKAGAKYAVVDRVSLEGTSYKFRKCIVVEDTLKMMQALARIHRMHFDIPVVGVTGTNGKTTTKELIAAVLGAKYNVVATEANLNNHIGAPLTLFRINDRTQIAVVEMGASAPGEIAELVGIVGPTCGLITSVGKAHLQGFGSFEGVKKAKGELYDILRQKGGTVFYNADNPHLCEMVSSRKGLVTKRYGVAEQGVAILPVTAKEPYLRIQYKGATISTKLVGGYNADNVMAALAVGEYFEVPFEKAAAAISAYTPSNNRSQLVRTSANTVIIDAYNANPSSMEASLGNFKATEFEGKTLILGDMLELGADSQQEHCRVLEKALEITDAVFLVGGEFRKAAETLGVTGKASVFDSSADLIEYLKENPLSDRTVLLKGSNGTRLQGVVKAL